MISVASVAVALAALPVHHEDRANPYKGAQLVTVARAIASVAKTKDEAAFLLALGHHESGFSFRIQLGVCRAFECDKGRAQSPWQLWKNNRSTEEWHGFVGLSLEATKAAAGAALQHVRYAERACRYAADPVVGTFRAYGGLGCDVPLKGEKDRVQTFRAARARL